MTEVAIALPQSLFRIKSGSFRLRSFKTTAATQFYPQYTRREGARDQLWMCDVESTAVSRAELIELEGWFARMEDKDWFFEAYDPMRQIALGNGNGFNGSNTEILFLDSTSAALSFCSDFSILEGGTHGYVSTAASRGARSVLVSGLDTSLAGAAVVKRGDHFGVGVPGEMNLHMSVGDAVIDSTGATRITFQPPLWKSALVGDIVDFYRPTARFALVDGESGTVIREPGELSRGIPLLGVGHPYQEKNT